jgi:prepilin signal peptidase PulO-like enzyme (type II secretory pathway)
MLTLLVSLVIFDLKWFLLPDKLVYTLISLAGASKLVQVFYFQDFQRVIGIAGGIVVGFGVFFALSYFSKGKYIGDGDVKYGLFFGILLGSPFKALLVISLGSLLGTLLTLPSLLTHKKKLTSVIPYGPSLIVATIVLYIFGDRIIDLLTTTYLFP